jgi:multidrug efflux system outer membrane protein
LKALIILLIAGAAAGCTVGPDYKRPIVTVPDTYRGAAALEPTAPDAVSIGDQAWWDLFQDEQLQELIRTALQQNFDLRIAATRILQAQAQLGVTRADQFPTVDAGAAATRTRSARSTVPFPLDPFHVNDFQLTAGVAWEIDFWGKFRRRRSSSRCVTCRTPSSATAKAATFESSNSS